MAFKIPSWGWLLLRPGLFLAVQSAVAVVAALGGESDAGGEAAGWWPVVAIVVNLLMLLGIRRWAWNEYRACIRMERSSVLRDAPGALAVIVVSLLLVSVCNAAGMRLLFGESTDPAAAMFRPLPWAARWAVLLLLPVTLAALEIPWYYGVLQRRLIGAGWTIRAAAAAGGIAFSLQHAALPFLPDPRFLVWRGWMMLPFTLLLAAALQYRPRWMPFFLAAHGMMDLAFAAMIFAL